MIRENSIAPFFTIDSRNQESAQYVRKSVRACKITETTDFIIEDTPASQGNRLPRNLQPRCTNKQYE
jgi:hypothetical protein